MCACHRWVCGTPVSDGQITLELSNVGPFRLLLRPGRAVCQLSLVAMDGPADRPYGTVGVGRYQGQTGPTAARLRLSKRTVECL